MFRDLLLDGEITDGPRGIRPTVFVTVPMLTLLGEDIPADLNGYGPIDAVTARRLAANAPSFIRLLTHPETGVVLSVGRDRYKVPKDLRMYLAVRDGTCRCPGCSMPVARSDLDHTVDWQLGGETKASNLAFLCRGHHLLKHATGWTVEQDPGGSGILTWTSPTGRKYRTEPEQNLGR